MKKKLIILLLFLFMVGGFWENSYANSSSGKKIVTIVFDDSWSMDQEARYAYANYAMQAFISLLDAEDELYLIYMSDICRTVRNDPSNVYPSGLALSVDLSNPQAGTDLVRAKEWNGDGTPYSAIQVGYNELISHADQTPSTSYYLIVLSDGYFMDTLNNEQMIPIGEVQALFESFYEMPMPNQTRLNTYYLAIGPEAAALSDRPDLNFHARTAPDGQSMIHTIGQMADMISGRYRLESSEVAMLDGSTVSFTSALPLRSIAFLSQGREASVLEIIGPDGTSYAMTRNVTLAPDPYHADLPLFGNAIMAESKEVNMPAGTYTVRFTSEVDPESLTVMYEPALACKLRFSVGGQEIPRDALLGLLEGDEVTISCQIVEAGTEAKIDPALLAQQTSYYVCYQAGEEIVQEADGIELSAVLEGGYNRFVGSVTMPGFLPLTDDVRFDTDSVVYAVAADKKKVSARQNEMDGCEAVRFTITGDGEPLTGELAVRYTLSDPVVEGGSLDYDWTREQDGSYLFQPKGVTESIGELTVTTKIVGLPDIISSFGTMKLEESIIVESAPKIMYGIEVIQPQSEIRQNELENCEPICFYLTADGVRLTPQDAANYYLDEPVLSGPSIEYQWVFDEEQGCYLFIPMGECLDTGTLTITTGCSELEAETVTAIEVIPKIHYEIKVVADGVTQGEQKANQASLGKMEPILFYITADGRQLTKKEMEQLSLSLEAKFDKTGFFLWEFAGRKAGYKREIFIDENGIYHYQPKGWSAFFGNVSVTLKLLGETEVSTSFVIDRNIWVYGIPLGILCFLLVLIWCIIGWIRQPKFHNQIMEIVVYTKFGFTIQESPRIKVMKRRIGLIPWKACRMRIGDMVFIAGENRKIILDKECVKSRVVYAGKLRFMGKNAGNMGRLLRLMEPTKRDIRLIRGMELYVADNKSAEVIVGYRLTSN